MNNLPDLDGRSTFVFVLHSTYRGDAGTVIRKTLIRKRAREAGFFHCYGADHFLGYLKEGYIFSPGHPTPEELDQANPFGRTVASILLKTTVKPGNMTPRRP